MRYGLSKWSKTEDSPPTPSIPALPYGSSTALQEQSVVLVLESFLWGCISKHWRSSYSQHSACYENSKAWTRQLVQTLLEHTASLWQYRNGIIYGHTIDQVRALALHDLSHQVHLAFDEYAADPFHIPLMWCHLFHGTLDSLLRSSRDAMQCWLHYFHEAALVQHVNFKDDRDIAGRYFHQCRSSMRAMGLPQTIGINHATIHTSVDCTSNVTRHWLYNRLLRYQVDVMHIQLLLIVVELHVKTSACLYKEGIWNRFSLNYLWARLSQKEWADSFCLSRLHQLVTSCTSRVLSPY
jgi:hypothetical protein